MPSSAPAIDWSATTLVDTLAALREVAQLRTDPSMVSTVVLMGLWARDWPGTTVYRRNLSPQALDRFAVDLVASRIHAGTDVAPTAPRPTPRL